MNNSEKRKYLNAMLGNLNGPATIADLNNRSYFIKGIPHQLFKFKKLNKHTIDSITNDYIYLSNVNSLDDPFECINVSKLSKVYDFKNNRLTKHAIDFLISKLDSHFYNSEAKQTIKRLTIDCIYNKDKTIDNELFFRYNNAIECLVNLNNNFVAYFNSVISSDFEEAVIKPNEHIGVFSLSETRDNKVMWSLYGNQYKGICIEYEIPRISDVIKNLFPVIYTKKTVSRYEEKLLETIAAINQKYGMFKHLDVNECSIYECFCTKDSDWEYQKEWRLIGSIGKVPIKNIKIKAIYLGFKASKKKTKDMMEIAKDKFNLYKMCIPNGDKKIRYSTLYLCEKDELQ